MLIALSEQRLDGYQKRRLQSTQLTQQRSSCLRETAGKFGQEKLLGAIAYAKATPEPDRPFDVTRYAIEVKTASGEKIEKDFKQASGKEIKRAAALLRRKLKTQETPAVLQVPPLSGLLSGKTPKFRIAPFLSKAREKLKAVSPRPTLALTPIFAKA